MRLVALDGLHTLGGLVGLLRGLADLHRSPQSRNVATAAPRAAMVRIDREREVHAVLGSYF